jgi:hypothetical protein
MFTALQNENFQSFPSAKKILQKTNWTIYGELISHHHKETRKLCCPYKGGLYLPAGLVFAITFVN